MGAQAVRLSNLDIDQALENRDFEVLFQPIFDLGNGALARMETFVRWRHPSLGLLPPGAFISFFEAQGRMGELSRYVLEEALRGYTEWRGNYGPGFSINLAQTDLGDPDFPADVKSALKGAGFPADAVTLECPMPPVSTDLAAAVEQYAALRATGVRLAIEVRGRANDFLHTVDPFPFDEIKTGGAAILRFARTVRGPGMSAISELLDIANAAHASITAVGVEDQTSLSALRGLGFSAAQGNHLAKVGAITDFRPSMVNEVRKLLDLDDLQEDELRSLFRTGAPETPRRRKRAPSGATAQASSGKVGSSTRRKDTASVSPPTAQNTAENGAADDAESQKQPPLSARDRARRKAAALARKKGKEALRAEIAARRAKLGLSVPTSMTEEPVSEARTMQARLSQAYHGVEPDDSSAAVNPTVQSDAPADEPRQTAAEAATASTRDKQDHSADVGASDPSSATSSIVEPEAELQTAPETQPESQPETQSETQAHPSVAETVKEGAAKERDRDERHLDVTTESDASTEHDAEGANEIPRSADDQDIAESVQTAEAHIEVKTDNTLAAEKPDADEKADSAKIMENSHSEEIQKQEPSVSITAASAKSAVEIDVPEAATQAATQETNANVAQAPITPPPTRTADTITAKLSVPDASGYMIDMIHVLTDVAPPQSRADAGTITPVEIDLADIGAIASKDVQNNDDLVLVSLDKAPSTAPRSSTPAAPTSQREPHAARPPETNSRLDTEGVAALAQPSHPQKAKSAPPPNDDALQVKVDQQEPIEMVAADLPADHQIDDTSEVLLPLTATAVGKGLAAPDDDPASLRGDDEDAMLADARAVVARRQPRQRKNILMRKYRLWPTHFWPKSWKRAWRKRTANRDFVLRARERASRLNADDETPRDALF